MSSFKDFYKKSEQLPEDGTTQLLSTTIAVNVQQVLLPIVGGLFELDNARKAEEFGKEVANYATSDEVISSLSEQIGKPREKETEQEFVERASCVLREILKKKFNV